MKPSLKSIHKKTILSVFITVLAGVILGTVAFNVLTEEKTHNTEKSVNFLMVGNDSYSKTSDAIFIFSLDPVEKDITVVPIHSSTLVSLNGTSTALSNIYRAGGIQILIDKVTEILPVPIDNYIVADYQAFRYIVNSFGGVDIDVPCDMKYYDSKINYKIDLQKGFQNLDGKKAEMFIRYIPKENQDNLTREINQKAFVEEFISQKLNKDTLTNLPDLFSKILPYITSDITISDAPRLFSMIEELNKPKINILSLYGKYEIKDNVRYFVSDYEKNKDILKN